MLKLIITFIFLIIAFHSFSQIKGITATGDEVILYENGTWQYATIV